MTTKQYQVSSNSIRSILTAGLLALILLLVSMPVSEAGYLPPHENCPTVETNEATNVTDTAMTLNGNLKKMGDANNVSVYFEWGTDNTYGNQTDIQLMLSPGTFSAQLTGLDPETIIYDKQGMLKRFGGDDEVIKSVIESFIDEFPNMIMLVRKALQDQDIEALQSYSHTILGLSANVNAFRLKATADLLENAIKEMEYAQATILVEKLKKEFNIFVKEYAN